MHVLPAPNPRGQVSGLPGSLPDGRARVRQPARSESEINYVLNHKRVYILKEDVGTLPRFYYFFDK